MKIERIFPLLTVVFALVVAAYPVEAQAHSSNAVEITVSALNVRTGPSTAYRKLGLVYKGQKYIKITSSGSWVKIWFDGRSAWCHSSYVKKVYGGTGLKINATGLNVRRGPSTGYGKVGVTRNPQKYVLISRSGSWRKIWFDGRARWTYSGNGYASEISLGTSQPTSQPTPQPQPVPAGGKTVFAVDISHWSGKINNSVAAHWKKKGVKHVIVGTQRRNITRQQLQVCVNNGFTVDAYVFLYWHKSMTAQVKEALDRIKGFPITRLWLDIEAKPNGRSVATMTKQIKEAIKACGNTPYGIYTAKWFWGHYMKNSTAFSHVPLWYARYDKNPSMGTWSSQKFGGWKKPWGKQYQGTTKFGGVVVDFNTIKVVPRRSSP